MAVDNAVVRSDLDVVQRTVLDETHPRFQLLSHPMVASPEVRSTSDVTTRFSESSLRFYAGHSVNLGERDKKHAKWSGTGRGGATSRADVCKTIDRKVDACHLGYL